MKLPDDATDAQDDGTTHILGHHLCLDGGEERCLIDPASYPRIVANGVAPDDDQVEYVFGNLITFDDGEETCLLDPALLSPPAGKSSGPLESPPPA